MKVWFLTVKHQEKANGSVHQFAFEQGTPCKQLVCLYADEVLYAGERSLKIKRSVPELSWP